MTSILRLPYTLLRPIYEKTSFHTSVIEEIEDQELKGAYAHCRAITRYHAKTFYMATRFLPNQKQRSIFAIYGLCRYLDDLVDEAEDLMIHQKISAEDISAKLEAFKKRLTDTYEGAEQSDPILMAFFDVLKTYDISIDLPFDLIKGVESDLTKNRYNNFDELYDYSYKVASVVGLMTSEVFEYENPEALKYAIDLGIAMQLTNILRDVGEDLERNRIYIPQDEMKAFGVTEEDLFNHNMSRDFVQLMKFQVDRAKSYYSNADKGIPMLSKDSRLPVYLARENYSRILEKIEYNNYNVFKQRAFLNSSEKLSILPKAYFQMKTG
jgi:phytoene synthase